MYYNIESNTENFVDVPKQESNGLFLDGNLKTNGIIKAKSFQLSNGQRIAEVKKLGLPKNITYKNNKIGINQKNPRKALDIIGDLGVKGRLEIIGNANIGDKLCFIHPRTNKKVCISVEFIQHIHNKINKVKKELREVKKLSLKRNRMIEFRNRSSFDRKVLKHLNKHHKKINSNRVSRKHNLKFIRHHRLVPRFFPRSKLSNVWKLGDGISKNEKLVSRKARNRNHCISIVRRKHPTANGATLESRGKGRCYAEFNMRGRNKNKKYISTFINKK